MKVEKQETVKFSWWRTIKLIPMVMLAIAIYLFAFLVGWVDRFLTAFIPFVSTHSLFSNEYYTKGFFNSLARVLMSGLVYIVYCYTIK